MFVVNEYFQIVWSASSRPATLYAAEQRIGQKNHWPIFRVPISLKISLFKMGKARAMMPLRGERILVPILNRLPLRILGHKAPKSPKGQLMIQIIISIAAPCVQLICCPSFRATLCLPGRSQILQLPKRSPVALPFMASDPNRKHKLAPLLSARGSVCVHTP